MKIIILLINIIIFLKLINANNNEILFKICDNGGISVKNRDECFCPYAHSGKNCELKNDLERCTKAEVYDMFFNDICCMQKYRTESKLTDMKLTMYENENKNDNDKLMDILNMYGPWRDKDVQLLNMLFEKSETNSTQLKLKYKDFVNPDITKFPFQCNDEENKNPIAFTILTHKINLDAIRVLMDIYYKPYNYYVFHVDKCVKNQDSDNLINILKEIEIKHKKGTKYETYPTNINVMQGEERFQGVWGAITLVYMEIASYTKLFDMVMERSISTNKYSQWSHVINLSLNDMPLLPLSNLTNLLCENYKTNYLEEMSKKDFNRYNKTHIDYNKYDLHFEPMQIADDIMEKFDCGKTGMLNYYNREKIYDGTQWHILSSTYANYLIGNIRSIEKLFSFKFSNIPDETFFQSSKVFFPQVNKEIWTGDSHRMTCWLSNPFRDDKDRYGLTIEGIEQIPKNTWFIRKVYHNDVRKKLIEKFNLNE